MLYFADLDLTKPTLAYPINHFNEGS